MYWGRKQDGKADNDPFRGCYVSREWSMGEVPSAGASSAEPCLQLRLGLSHTSHARPLRAECGAKRAGGSVHAMYENKMKTNVTPERTATS